MINPEISGYSEEVSMVGSVLSKSELRQWHFPVNLEKSFKKFSPGVKGLTKNPASIA